MICSENLDLVAWIYFHFLCAFSNLLLFFCSLYYLSLLSHIHAYFSLEENDDHALLFDSGDCCLFLPLQLLFLMVSIPISIHIYKGDWGKLSHETSRCWVNSPVIWMCVVLQQCCVFSFSFYNDLWYCPPN